MSEQPDKNREPIEELPEDRLHEDDESYSFMKETVKKRPVKIRKVVARILAVIAFACLFGAIAAAVFMGITGVQVADSSGTHVSFGTDDTEAFSPGEGISDDRSGSGGSEVLSDTENEEHFASSTSESAGSPEVTSSENEIPQSDTVTETGAVNSSSPNTSELSEPTEEEREAAALDNYLALQSAMKSIAEEGEKSIVQVTGITDTEDWFNNTENSTKSASGLIIAETEQNILILTDVSATNGSNRIVVTFKNEESAEAQTVKSDPVTGLCVITVDRSAISEETRDTFQTAVLGNSYNIHAGDSVIAIGSPLGYSNSVVFGETTSVDSSVSVTDGVYNLIQTTCLGSASGSGVLINLDGEVVGVLAQQFAGENSSVVTALPISMIKQLIEKLSNNEAIGYMGITGETVPEALTEEGIPEGVYITSVDADSPALLAGLAPGDIVQNLDGNTVTGMYQLQNRIMNAAPGSEATVQVMRSGASGYVEFTFTVSIGERS